MFHTSYAYDPLRQITGVTDDQGNVTSVAYDLFGRRTAINSPDAGNTAFTYDLADNVTAKQTANLRAAAPPQQVTFAYQFNRVTAITYPNFPANNVTYTYGAASQRNPSPVGNVVGRITDGAGTEDRLYGPLGEIVQETRTIPISNKQSTTYTTQYQYDTWNRLLNITYPDPNHETVTYSYDSGGLVNGVSGNDDLRPNYVTGIYYDKFGHRLLLQIGDGTTTTNGTTTTYVYHPVTQRLNNLQATTPANCYTFHDFFFSYDAVGNITEIDNFVTDPHSSGCNADRRTAYLP